MLVHHHHHCEHFFWEYLSPLIRHQVHADDAEKHFIIYLLIWSDLIWRFPHNFCIISGAK
jgi:hypothetical protein